MVTVGKRGRPIIETFDGKQALLVAQDKAKELELGRDAIVLGPQKDA